MYTGVTARSSLVLPELTDPCIPMVLKLFVDVLQVSFLAIVTDLSSSVQPELRQCRRERRHWLLV